jgi:hypothetical protein
MLMKCKAKARSHLNEEMRFNAFSLNLQKKRGEAHGAVYIAARDHRAV